jgi:hypothetical protein
MYSVDLWYKLNVLSLFKVKKGNRNGIGLPQFRRTFIVEKVNQTALYQPHNYYWFIASLLDETAELRWGVLRFPTFSHRLSPTLGSPRQSHTLRFRRLSWSAVVSGFDSIFCAGAVVRSRKKTTIRSKMIKTAVKGVSQFPGCSFACSDSWYTNKAPI